MNNDIFCKLLYLDNIKEFDKFISKIANIFKHNNKKNKKYILDNPEFNFDNNLCICNFEKHNNPRWL